MREWKEQEQDSPRTPHAGRSASSASSSGSGSGSAHDVTSEALARFASSGQSPTGGSGNRVPFAAGSLGSSSGQQSKVSVALERARNRQAAEENRRNADALLRGAQMGADVDGGAGEPGPLRQGGEGVAGMGADGMPMEASEVWRANEEKERQRAQASAQGPWLGRSTRGPPPQDDGSSVGGSMHAAVGVGFAGFEPARRRVPSVRQQGDDRRLV